MTILGIGSRGVAALLLALSTIGLAVVGACATKKGALMLAINTDMMAPKDVNAVSITISTNGAIKHSFIGRVTPQGEVLLPATLAIVEPDDKSATIRIRVMAFQDRRPRVMRDVRTTVPPDGRIALLRIPLNFVNDAMVTGAPLPDGLVPDPIPGTGGVPSGGTSGTSGTSGSSGGTSSGGGNFGGGAADFDFFGAFQPPCPDIQNQTIIDGECHDNYVDPATLPDFDQAAIGDSADPGSCFELAKCFADAVGVGEGPSDTLQDAGADVSVAVNDGAAPPPNTDAGPKPLPKDLRPAAITLDTNTCALQLNGADPARLNLAIVTPDTGACVRPGECYIPIDRGPSGWQDENGSVQLPKFVCTLLNGKSLRLVTSSDTCAAKEESNPVCAVGGTPDSGGGSGTSGSSGTSGVDAGECSSICSSSVCNASTGICDPCTSPRGLGLCVANCASGGTATTSVTGSVYDSAGMHPLTNVNVFIPRDPSGALSADASPAEYLAMTSTDSFGKFTLTGAPAAKHVPLVARFGAMSSLTFLAFVAPCVDNALTDQSLRLACASMTCIPISQGGNGACTCN